MATICQEEMYKLREHGGAKLSNIHAKSEASKIQWLIELCSNPILATHLALVKELLGEQKGGIQGTGIFFTNKHHARRILKITSPYYLEAIRAMPTLDTRKQILNPRGEKVFYNPVFAQENKEMHAAEIPIAFAYFPTPEYCNEMFYRVKCFLLRCMSYL